jgi:hypothetical protein
MKLELTLQELEIVAAALREMPYKLVASLLTNIDGQVQPQLNPDKPAEG